ncbi:hypothetical protein [Curtobacterium sp. MCBD17_030]|uniref:hypothetical protein n=1 Tax=Curtobacterium sp. MCBD17_030 TaxID=2175649 RepID=UPI000D85D81E|nr:hypothetical protein [Curtobacterium sp. MCBD17_030]PYY32814.1 hypothetical protein DEI89_12095 [Curtobacterium sp. MCBD17_030]
MRGRLERLADAVDAIVPLVREVDDVGGHAAERFQGHADRLRRDELTRSQRNAALRDFEALLGAGSGRLSDRYLVHDDGRPDLERSGRFTELVGRIRSQAWWLRHFPF